MAPFHTGKSQQTVTCHRVPLGEVEMRCGEPVHATDGEIGRVQGLVIAPRNYDVTHVLLQEGHLWGRKEVAIPVSAVASTGNGIRLKITKQEVQDLPPAGIDHPDGSTGGRGGHGWPVRTLTGLPGSPGRCGSSRAPRCGCRRTSTQGSGSGCARRKTGCGSSSGARGC